MQMGVITAVIAASTSIGQLAILQHPLVETFLRLKWARLRIFFFLLVLVHIIFVISLSAYALMFIRNVYTYAIHRGFLTICASILFGNNIIQVLFDPRYNSSISRKKATGSSFRSSYTYYERTFSQALLETIRDVAVVCVRDPIVDDVDSGRVHGRL